MKREELKARGIADEDIDFIFNAYFPINCKYSSHAVLISFFRGNILFPFSHLLPNDKKNKKELRRIPAPCF